MGTTAGDLSAGTSERNRLDLCSQRAPRVGPRRWPSALCHICQFGELHPADDRIDLGLATSFRIVYDAGELNVWRVRDNDSRAQGHVAGLPLTAQARNMVPPLPAPVE